MSQQNPPPSSSLKHFVIIETDEEDDAFELYDYVITKYEYREYELYGRPGDTPVYRIVDQDGDYHYYELRDVQTGRGNFWCFQHELELLEKID